MTELQTQLRTILRGRNTPDALVWIIPALTAATDPDAWCAAFCNLENADQYELLGLLRGAEAGIGGAVLLAVLAQLGGQIPDAQIRQFVAEEAAHAHDRMGQTLAALRDRVQSLLRETDDASARLDPAFDVEAEVQRLSCKLAELRAREVDLDDRFAQVHSLETEVVRFETRQRILQRYDPAARQQYREALRAEVDAGEADKRRLEAEISAAIGDRDTAVREAARLAEEVRAARTEAAAASASLDELRATLQEAREVVSTAGAARRSLEDETAVARAEADRIEREHAEIDGRLRRERARLDELQRAAQAAGAHEVMERTRALYQSLPPDRADEAFAATRRSP